MVYLLKMVIFHGYVSHSQMVCAYIIYLIFWKLQVWFAAYSLISRGWMDGHPWVATCHREHVKALVKVLSLQPTLAARFGFLEVFTWNCMAAFGILLFWMLVEQHHQKSFLPDTVHALETPTESTGGLKQITSYRDSFEIARQALFGESCEDGRPS